MSAMWCQRPSLTGVGLKCEVVVPPVVVSIWSCPRAFTQSFEV